MCLAENKQPVVLGKALPERGVKRNFSMAINRNLIVPQLEIEELGLLACHESLYLITRFPAAHAFDVSALCNELTSLIAIKIKLY